MGFASKKLLGPKNRCGTCGNVEIFNFGEE
jgi:hypothetical protein